MNSLDFNFMSLDFSKLLNVQKKADKTTAACPACAENGGDTKGNHLVIWPDGRFGCAVHSQDSAHRKRIFALAGSKTVSSRNNAHHKTKPASKAKISAAYDYQDENGNLLFQVVRMEPKSFRQRHKVNDEWVWNMEGVRRAPYRLPEVLKARDVFVCEGEKDADNVKALGFCATTNPMGAGKWHSEYNEPLRGKHVVIIPDNDEPGHKHAETVARALYGMAASVKVLALPDLPEKWDVSDWLAKFEDKADAAEQLSVLAEGAMVHLSPTETSRNEPAKGLPCEDVAAIRGKLISIFSVEGKSASFKKTQIGKVVADALTERGAFYFHAERRDHASCMFFDGTRKVLLRIQSDEFQSWLANWLALNRADSIFSYILSAVEDAALAGTDTKGILPESFFAAHPETIYISNGDGHIVRVTSHGAEVVNNGTDGVLFAAGHTLPPWKPIASVDPFISCSLFRDANCSASHGLDLVRLFFLSLPTVPTCKPPLVLSGDVRSGKTRLARGMAEVWGLPQAVAKVEENGESDFWSGMDAGGLSVLDNCDTRTKWLADAVAAAATGGCREKRRLYTDSEIVRLRARSWLVLTSANPTFASDCGLADRLLVVRMARRNGATSDSVLSEEICANRDGALSWVAANLSKALGDAQPVPSDLNSRHPDFAAFGVRLGRAIGREAEIVDALRAAESDKATFCIENDVIGAALLLLFQRIRFFRGTSAELLQQLVE